MTAVRNASPAAAVVGDRWIGSSSIDLGFRQVERTSPRPATGRRTQEEQARSASSPTLARRIRQGAAPAHEVNRSAFHASHASLIF
jgi:hypothetical protein